MYGLVNKALEKLVCKEHSEDTWENIKAQATVDVEVFIGLDVYPDDMTYRLLDAASALTERPVDELLEALGEYWPSFTAHEGYEHLINITGSSLQEFLENLDALHACLVESFPRIRPPTFSYEEISPVEFKLHYYSRRKGLAPMVIGLVKALAKRFNENIKIYHMERRDSGSDHDVFRIHLEGEDPSDESRQTAEAND